MTTRPIDLSPLRNALAMLAEANQFWQQQPAGDPLKPHLRSAVIQSFEFSYELSVRLLRRALIERAASNEEIADLSFADLLRVAADAGLIDDPMAWRRWREMRNATSHAYSEARAQAVASGAAAFCADGERLLSRLEGRAP